MDTLISNLGKNKVHVQIKMNSFNEKYLSDMAEERVSPFTKFKDTLSMIKSMQKHTVYNKPEKAEKQKNIIVSYDDKFIESLAIYINPLLSLFNTDQDKYISEIKAFHDKLILNLSDHNMYYKTLKLKNTKYSLDEVTAALSNKRTTVMPACFYISRLYKINLVVYIKDDLGETVIRNEATQKYLHIKEDYTVEEHTDITRYLSDIKYSDDIYKTSVEKLKNFKVKTLKIIAQDCGVDTNKLLKEDLIKKIIQILPYNKENENHTRYV